MDVDPYDSRVCSRYTGLHKQFVRTRIYVLYVTFGVFTGKSRVSSETNTAQEL